MRKLLIVLLLAGFAQCQTKSAPKPTHKPTVSERLDKIETFIEETVKAKDDLKTENDKLKAANKDLADKLEAINTKYEELRKNAREVLNFGTAANSEYAKVMAVNAELTSKYNALLSQANSIIEQQNARLAYQQRVNNALAIYGMMPKYSPPQNINVQFSDCTKYPALCVGH